MARLTGNWGIGHQYGLSLNYWDKGPLCFPRPRTPQSFGSDLLSKTRLHSRWEKRWPGSGTALHWLNSSRRLSTVRAAPCCGRAGLKLLLSASLLLMVRQFLLRRNNNPVWSNSCFLRSNTLKVCVSSWLIWARGLKAHIIGHIISLLFSLVCFSKYWEVTDRINSLYSENFKSTCKYWFGS